MNDREKLIIKMILCMFANHENKGTPKYLDHVQMLKILDEIRKTQHSSVSFDEMMKICEELTVVCDETAQTTNYFL